MIRATTIGIGLAILTLLVMLFIIGAVIRNKIVQDARIKFANLPEEKTVDFMAHFRVLDKISYDSQFHRFWTRPYQELLAAWEIEKTGEKG